MSWLAAGCLSAMVLVSCFPEDAEPMPISYIAFLHAAPDTPNLAISLDDSQLNPQQFAYKEGYYGYYQVLAGQRRFRIAPVSSSDAIVDTTLNLVETFPYTLIISDLQPDVSMRFVPDTTSVIPSDGYGVIRFIHLAPDVGEVEVLDSKSGNVLFSEMEFDEVTVFGLIREGTRKFNIRTVSEADTLVTSSQFTITGGKAYTILFRGLGAPPEGNSNDLEVRLINNF